MKAIEDFKKKQENMTSMSLIELPVKKGITCGFFTAKWGKLRIQKQGRIERRSDNVKNPKSQSIANG